MRDNPRIVIYEESGIRLKRDVPDGGCLWLVFDALAWLMGLTGRVFKAVAGLGYTLLRLWFGLVIVLALMLTTTGAAQAQESPDPLTEREVQDAVDNALVDYFGDAFDLDIPTPEEMTDAVMEYIC
jgi:hypothetical protein